MNRKVLFTIILVTLTGCASAPHPLLRAFAPENVVGTVKGSSTTHARVSASAKVPLIPKSHILIENRGGQTIVILRPPFNTAEFARIYREEQAKKGNRVTVVTEPKHK